MEVARMTTDEAGKRDTIVIGASAGGIHALRQILCAFPPGLDAAIFIVLHLPADPSSILDVLLGQVTSLVTAFAKDGEAILAGRIYVAPPDRHLLLYEDRMTLSHGERENRSRPAIDPLFRSAAVARQGRVIGAILSGLLNDGSAGLLSVKRCGGLAFVQAVDDAREKEMPGNAAKALGGMLDGAMPAADLGRHIATMVGSPATNAVVPLDVELEVAMLLGSVASTGKALGGLPQLVMCPECGGPLLRIGKRGHVLHYTCSFGHVFDPSGPLAAQVAQNEQVMWATIKGLEERSRRLWIMARYEAKFGRDGSAARFNDEAARLLEDATTLRAVLLTGLLREETPR